MDAKRSRKSIIFIGQFGIGIGDYFKKCKKGCHRICVFEILLLNSKDLIQINKIENKDFRTTKY